MKNNVSNKEFWKNLLNDSSDDDGSFNLISNCLDRHRENKMICHKVAVKFISKKWKGHKTQSQLKGDDVIDITYDKLIKLSCQFAHVLKSLEIAPGEVLYSLSHRSTELFTVSLGTLRAGVIFSPLFSSFGPDPVRNRLIKGRGHVLCCDEDYFKQNLLSHFAADDFPHLKVIILFGSKKKPLSWGDKKIFYFNDVMNKASDEYILEKTSPQDPALLHFTSGTTGEPKGALHIHKAQIYHEFTGQNILGLDQSDIFWCTADPGWVTGISYGVIAPLSLGATVIVDEEEFLAPRWYNILSHFKVTNWYTSPTALRMLMRSGEQLAHQFDLSAIKKASSVGEPLNPEIISWILENLKIRTLDNWWQTETGGIIIGNHNNLKLKIGSMGKPVAHVDVKIIKNHSKGKIEFSHVNEVGEIAIKRGWPSMFVTYLYDTERYEKSFEGDWYLSGDLGRLDEEGYFWFVGRKDDVIKTSGHLVGPFEIESSLLSHPLVYEAAVIGLPDPLIGEKVIAYVSHKECNMNDEDLRRELLSHVRKKLGAAISPREIKFLQNIPKTKSGKIMRRYLRAQELHLPLGDVSTMENFNEL